MFCSWHTIFLIVETWLHELFQKRFWNIDLTIRPNPKYDGDQRQLASILCMFFDKWIGSGASVNEKLAEEIHRSVIKKCKRRNVRFEDNIFDADLPQIVLERYFHQISLS